MNASKDFRLCFIIPCYNHTDKLDSILQKIDVFGVPIILVNDGSSPEHTKKINELENQFPHLIVIKHESNKGKGGAVISGLKKAKEKGFSHALQIDADGQHQLEDIPKFIKCANEHPDYLISGQPIYDESIPKSRLYGRYITHFWVNLETLSFTIKDSMCGFRIYPIAATNALISKVNLGMRMDFDIEIMVRLYWKKTPICFIPISVIYPENGVSHFKAFKDNLLISWMHTKLFFGMLIRIPQLIQYKNKPTHWSKTNEREGLCGIKFLLQCYRLFGKRIIKLVLYPVIFFFWLTGTQQRKASVDYLNRLYDFAAQKQIELPPKPNSFQHFLHFGNAIFDKLAVWMGDIHISDLIIQTPEAYQEQRNKQEGVLVLCSHLGNIEVCRALGELEDNKIINALVFTEHAQKFNKLIQEINPNSNLNLIEVSSITPEIIILLKEKLDRGEWVAIVGDRTPPNEYSRDDRGKIVWSSFLGKKAPFPQGPFILAAVLKCPVFLMFGLKQEQKHHFYFEQFCSELQLPRAQRQEALQNIVDLYAQKLEEYCFRSPLDWFNFYDFWQHNDSKRK